ncbi:MAG: thioester reductase domain-containing protein, partial [Gammaproteobacteria bacterium]
KIYCLVRGDTPQIATQRCRAIMTSYQLSDYIDETRLCIVPGDLTLPQFGLLNTDYLQLAKQTQVIYHVGADVNFIKPLDLLLNANVEACQRVLHFSQKDQLKTIHYVSTLSAFPRGGDYIHQHIDEHTPMDLSGYLLGGYEQSKWLGEAIMRNAQQQKLPITIYRPGFIGGSLETGILNDKDLFSRMLLSIIQTTFMPDILPFNFNIVPVDYITQSMVYLASQPERMPVYHFYHERALTIDEIHDAFLANHFPIQTKPYQEWVAYLEECGKDHDYPLKPLLALLNVKDPMADSQLGSHALLPNQGDIYADITKSQLPPTILGKLLPPIELLDFYLKKLSGQYGCLF